MSRHKSPKPDTDSALAHAETCRLEYMIFPPLSQKLSLFLTLEERRRWRSGGWREEPFAVEQENKVMLVLLQSQFYVSYHEKIFTMRIPTCEKPSKKIIKTLLHSDSVLTCCKNMGGCHQVNKNCSKVMRHHYNWSMNLHLVFVYLFVFVVRERELWQKSCLSLFF